MRILHSDFISQERRAQLSTVKTSGVHEARGSRDCGTMHPALHRFGSAKGSRERKEWGTGIA